jgi:arginyl-tRNA synthetase
MLKDLKEAISKELAQYSLSDFLPEFTCTLAPLREDALAATNLAFLLAKVLSKKPFPQQVAAELVSLLELNLSKDFMFSIGGQGFINIIPTAQYLKRFFREAGADPKGFFFDNTPEQIKVDWDEQYYNEKLLKSDLAREFLNHLQPLPKNRNLTSDSLTLLAMLTDQDFDLTVYLRGLNGRENIPWYIERFLFDANRHSTSLTTAAHFPEDEFWKTQLDLLLSQRKIRALNLFHELLFFREELRLTFQLRQPERLLRAILKLIQSFYTLFNNPKMRQSDILDLTTPLLTTIIPYSQQLLRFSGSLS